MNYQFLDQPPEGYLAIRFNRHVVLNDVLVRNDAFIEAGATFLLDRKIMPMGLEVYCGPVAVNVGPLSTACFSYAQGAFSHEVYLDRRKPIPLPPGSFTITRVRID